MRILINELAEVQKKYGFLPEAELNGLQTTIRYRAPIYMESFLSIADYIPYQKASISFGFASLYPAA